MNDRFESLASGEVISINNDRQSLTGHRTSRVEELNDALAAQLASAISGWHEGKSDLFSERGIDCEALRFGSNGWQKGRIRLHLEFCPDDENSNSRSDSYSNPLSASGGTTSLGNPAPTANSSPANPVMAPHSEPSAIAEPIVTPNAPNYNPLGVAMPAAGVVAAGTAVAATIANAPAQQSQNSPVVDATLEEHPADPIASNSGNLEEIAFEFDLNGNERGVANIGTMELDLSDSSLDFSEYDLLDLEPNGTYDPTDEVSLNDDRPENSGMLIDEVWNEINQGNWPSIN